jgi:hypothetical protein
MSEVANAADLRVGVRLNLPNNPVTAPPAAAASRMGDFCTFSLVVSSWPERLLSPLLLDGTISGSSEYLSMEAAVTALLPSIPPLLLVCRVLKLSVYLSDSTTGDTDVGDDDMVELVYCPSP